MMKWRMGLIFCRVSNRNQQDKMKKVYEKAAELTRKRNLEGLLKGTDKETLNNGVQVLMKETSRLASLLVPAGADGSNT